MSFPTEQDLLAAAKEYDLESLGTIYDRFNKEIFVYAVRLLGDDRLAEDCVSETFSRFLKALQFGAGPKDHLKAYLYRIAHNWITDSYRRHIPEVVELDESFKSDETMLPEKQAESNLIIQQLRLVLRSLTPDQRQVVALRYLEGWENEEVAAALGKNVGAVKALQHRALDTMQRILLREEIDFEKRFA
jgi:RNA polymerase sigma-70 factor, ECF subfamily